MDWRQRVAFGLRSMSRAIYFALWVHTCRHGIVPSSLPCILGNRQRPGWSIPMYAMHRLYINSPRRSYKLDAAHYVRRTLPLIPISFSCKVSSPHAKSLIIYLRHLSSQQPQPLHRRHHRTLNHTPHIPATLPDPQPTPCNLEPLLYPLYHPPHLPIVILLGRHTL